MGFSFDPIQTIISYCEVVSFWASSGSACKNMSTATLNLAFALLKLRVLLDPFSGVTLADQEPFTVKTEMLDSLIGRS